MGPVDYGLDDFGPVYKKISLVWAIVSLSDKAAFQVSYYLLIETQHAIVYLSPLFSSLSLKHRFLFEREKKRHVF